MAADKTIKALIKQIEGAIDSFGKSVPSIQRGMLDQLNIELKDLQLNNGKILNSVQNLKLIGSIKNKIERLLISQNYKDSVKDFVKSFDTVSDLQHQYFAQFNKKFKPPKTLDIIKELSVDKTLNDLIGQGLQVNVVDRLGKVLSDNITSGGSYASLTNQVRGFLEDNDGAMVRYSRTITTDAINQYSAQYHDAIAQDLKFDWGRYVGSNLTTTREFCELLTEKEWVHRSELPKIVKGEIDGAKCKLSKAGLPLGMIPGTDADNFKVRRGGYNCGHQFFWVPDSAVPDEIKNKLYPKKPISKKPVSKPVTKKPASVSDKIKQNNTTTLESLKKRGIEFPEEILNLMPENVTIVDDINGGSFYNPDKNILAIGGKNRASNPYYQKKIVLHEGGHAIHLNKKIITLTDVQPEFKNFYKSLQDKISGHEFTIDELLWAKGYASNNDITLTEQIGMLHDTLGSLTKGKYGAGHSHAYYNQGNFSYMEVFAHSITLARMENQFIDLHPALKEIALLMKEYGSKILEGI